MTADGDIDQLTNAIVGEDLVKISAIFLKNRAPCPEIKWTPNQSDIYECQLRSLLLYWEALRGEMPVPRAADFDPVALPEVLGHLMLMEVIEGGADFSYRVYGMWIANESGYKMTGKRISALPRESPILSALLFAGNRAVVQNPKPLLMRHGAPPTMVIDRWERLVLPLSNEDGVITRVLVGLMPDRRDFVDVSSNPPSTS